MIGQNGKSSTMNAWLPSAVLGTKVVDAVGDIRAHPTGDMGSIGLGGIAAADDPDGGRRQPQAKCLYRTGGARRDRQSVAGPAHGSGHVGRIHRILPQSRCRRPMCKKNAALGGISIALALGEAILNAEPKGGNAVIDAICRETQGEIIGSGKVVREVGRLYPEAFDIGTIRIGAGAKATILHVMNEYMAVDDAQGARLAGFPDVIATLDPDGVPVSVGELREGQELLVLRIAKTFIPLSSSATDPSVYPVVEKALGINLTDYALG